LRLHTETACRRGGALALRPRDLDPNQHLVLVAQHQQFDVLGQIRPDQHRQQPNRHLTKR
jgi:hypothetical protein